MSVEESGSVEIDDQPAEAGGLARVWPLVVGVVVIDQLTKAWAESSLADGPIDLFWTLRFRLIYNTGSAFSLGSGFGPWFALVVTAVVIGLVVWLRSIPETIPRLLIGAIIGGAIGNLIDRVFRADDGFLSGAVVDFIDFQWWPVFNIADIAVVCGAIALMLISLREPT